MEPRDGRRARGDPILARERSGRRRHAPVLVDHRDALEPVPLADGEVVRIVGRRHLHGPRAELGIDEVVRDDRKLPPQDRQAQSTADPPGVACVVGVHGHRGVA